MTIVYVLGSLSNWFLPCSWLKINLVSAVLCCGILLLEKHCQQQAGIRLHSRVWSLLCPRDLLIACEMIPSFLLQIIHFPFWLTVPGSQSPVPLIISTATCCVSLLCLQLHIIKKKIYLFLVFIFISDIAFFCYLLTEQNVNKSLLAKYCRLMWNQSGRGSWRTGFEKFWGLFLHNEKACGIA